MLRELETGLLVGVRDGGAEILWGMNILLSLFGSDSGAAENAPQMTASRQWCTVAPWEAGNECCEMRVMMRQLHRDEHAQLRKAAGQWATRKQQISGNREGVRLQ